MPCRSIIPELEVIRAHNISSLGLSGNLTRPSDCQSHRRFDVIDLKNTNHESVLDREIAFEFFLNSQLLGSVGNGKVAKLGTIRIKEAQKVNGIGKEIHAQHLLVLSQNQFKEIQLKAKWDGVIVWPSLFFKFRNEDDEDELIEHISVYMLDVLGFPRAKVSRILDQYDGMQSINSHLKPNGKTWFTEWYQGTNRTLQYEMYKEVS